MSAGAMAALVAVAGALVPALCGETPLLLIGPAGIEVPWITKAPVMDRLWMILTALTLWGVATRGGLRRVGVFALLLSGVVWLDRPEVSLPTARAVAERQAAEPELTVVWPILAFGPFRIDEEGSTPFRPPFERALHPLGTDGARRDVLSRLLYGARRSLAFGLAVALPAGIIGLALGLSCSGARGAVAGLLRAVIATATAFPTLLVLIAFAGPAAGDSELTATLRIAVVLACTRWAGFARIARHKALVVSSSDFMLAARAQGQGFRSRFLHHLWPHLRAPLLVHGAFAVIHAILLESALGFLGLGAKGPEPTLGGMLASWREEPEASYHLVVAASAGLIAILALVRQAATVTARREALSVEPVG